MKYVVTGGAGFIGSTFIDEVLRQDKESTVICIDDFSTGFAKNIPQSFNVKVVNVDISTLTSNNENTDKIKKEVAGADYMLHFAAKARVQPSIENPIKFNDTNVGGTLNLLEICRQVGIKRFVFSSSSSIYGDTDIFPTPETAPMSPLSPYGLQKLIGEQYCQLYSTIHNLETVCLRYFNVYGDKMPTSGAYCLVMGVFAQLKQLGNPLTIYGDGEQRRDFTSVEDVIQANLLSCTSNKVGKGEIINIGNGNNKSVQDIADIFGGPFEYKPKRLEPFQTLADNTKARELLGWEPTGNVEEWLGNYINENLRDNTN
jgi:UDP-glucose 4-epimerase